MMRPFCLAAATCLTSVTRQPSGCAPQPPADTKRAGATCAATQPPRTPGPIVEQGRPPLTFPAARAAVWADAASIDERERGPVEARRGTRAAATYLDLYRLLPTDLRLNVLEQDARIYGKGYVDMLAPVLPPFDSPEEAIVHLRSRRDWAALEPQIPLLVSLTVCCVSGKYPWLTPSVLTALLELPEAAKLVDDAVQRGYNPLLHLSCAIGTRQPPGKEMLTHAEARALMGKILDLTSYPQLLVKVWVREESPTKMTDKQLLLLVMGIGALIGTPCVLTYM